MSSFGLSVENCDECIWISYIWVLDIFKWWMILLFEHAYDSL